MAAATAPTSKALDEVVPGFMFLSSVEEATDIETLRSNGITHILTVGGGMPAMYREEFSYQLVEGLQDVPDAVILGRFEECFSFIEHALAQNGRLLVHCEGGVSRSATICAAYLMKTENIGADVAVQRLQAIRQKVSPNQGFKDQLQLFGELNYRVTPDDVAAYEKSLEANDVAASVPATILSQDMFETPTEDETYELKTSSKASTFIETILTESMPKKKKVVSHPISADDASLGQHKNRAFTSSESIVESSFADTEAAVAAIEAAGAADPSLHVAPAAFSAYKSMPGSSKTVSHCLTRPRQQYCSTRLFELAQEPIQSESPPSTLASVPAQHQPAQHQHQHQPVSSETAQPAGSTKLQRFRTSSSNACSLDQESIESSDDQGSEGLGTAGTDESGTDDYAGQPPAVAAEAATTPLPHNEATLAVGKVLHGYAMTPADERVVTQWLATKPEALTGGQAFKGLRQALRMMRRFNNTPDKEEQESKSVEGLQHSLRHVSTILEQFTGFPLHSPEFMRLLQSDDGLDATLVALEEEFKTALNDVRAANKPSGGVGPSTATAAAVAAAPPFLAEAEKAAAAVAKAAVAAAPLAQVELGGGGGGGGGGRPRNETLIGFPPAMKARNPRTALGTSMSPPCSPTNSPQSPTPFASPPQVTSTLMLHGKKGTMTPGRPPPVVDGCPSPEPAENADHAVDLDLEQAPLHRRRRSATIDLLLLLSKLGLRREQKVSDRLYHSLSQFLEGGNKEMGALENLDDQSAIELLGYLESFPPAMKDEPRIARLALICKARLVLMVGISTVDSICDDLLAQSHVRGHVRDVATYCLNFSGALIGTQMSILRKAKQEMKMKAAARIQAWRRKMCEADEKPPVRVGSPQRSLMGACSPTRRSHSLRSWQSFEVSSPLQPGGSVNGDDSGHGDGQAGSASPASASCLPQQSHQQQSQEQVGMQSSSTLASINLALSERRIMINQVPLGMESPSGINHASVPATARARTQARSRQTLTERPQRSMYDMNDVDLNTYPIGGGASSAAAAAASAAAAAASAAAAGGAAAVIPGGLGLGSVLSSRPPTARGGATLRKATTAAVPAQQLGGTGKMSCDMASVTSSNSLSSSAFYPAGDNSPKGQMAINPVHALYGILKHLCRAVVSEANQNMEQAYPMSQKLKTLQGHAKKLKLVHPRVCVADGETREGLRRLPKASAELEKYIREHKHGANQTPYCYDHQLRVLAFFPPCEMDTATQPPDDTSACFRKILSTVFDLMPVDSEALHDLTETAVLSQHASAGYALTTTLHYVDKLCKTSFMASHHLGDETCGVGGSVAGGYVHYDQDNGRYIFTEESGHYGLRWTLPGTRQSLDVFMKESNLDQCYLLKPFLRQGAATAGTIASLFKNPNDEDEEEEAGGEGAASQDISALATAEAQHAAATAAATAAAIDDSANSDWDFDD